MGDLPFWRRKRLDEMTAAEWESLCDGCGRCCLIRLVDEESGESGETNVACKLLDVKTCRCTDYPNRKAKVPTCMRLTPALAKSEDWLPATCAYRRLALGQDLPEWHPLITGRAESVAEAGVSALGWIVSETDIEIEDDSDLWDYVYHTY
jgi:hypothetical protein